MNLLGIDYGRKHTGIAVATTFVAEPLEVVLTKNVVERIKQYLKEYQIDAIVVGLSENEMGTEIKDFVASLRQDITVPLYFQDETLSSQDSRRQLAQMGVKRSKRQAKTDHYAAATILQDFIDTH